MKKYVLILLIICSLCLYGCGSKQAEESTPVSTAAPSMESVLPGSTLKDEAAETEDSAFIKAQEYIDKDVENLIAALGEPKTREYTPSCLGDGEDGNLEYDGFCVFTYKEGGKEVVKDVTK